MSALVAWPAQTFAVSAETYQAVQQASKAKGTVVDKDGVPVIGDLCKTPSKAIGN